MKMESTRHSFNLLPRGYAGCRHKPSTSAQHNSFRTIRDDSIHIHSLGTMKLGHNRLKMDHPYGRVSSFPDSMISPEAASRTGDVSTDTETDEESLNDILGGPYQTSEQRETEQEAGEVHLQYSIPRRKEEDRDLQADSDVKSKNRSLCFKSFVSKSKLRLKLAAVLFPKRLMKGIKSCRLVRRKRKQVPDIKDDTEPRSPVNEEHECEENPSTDAVFEVKTVSIRQMAEDPKPRMADRVSIVRTLGSFRDRRKTREGRRTARFLLSNQNKRNELEQLAEKDPLEDSSVDSSAGGASSTSAGSEMISVSLLLLMSIIGWKYAM